MTIANTHDPFTLLQSVGVSRETYERLCVYVDELMLWQNRFNLISPHTIPQIWQRHILDCAQLLQLRPHARHWVDLGSGAGLPGLVLACALAEKPGTHVHLVESNGKKASFLHHCVQKLALPASIHHGRIENMLPKLTNIDIVTARALASLDDLLAYSNLLLKNGAVGLFMKGQDAEEELTKAQKRWHFTYTLYPSMTESQSRIIVVENLCSTSR